MEDEMLLRSFIARTVGTLEGALSALELTKSPLFENLHSLLSPIIEEGHRLLPNFQEPERF